MSTTTFVPPHLVEIPAIKKAAEHLDQAMGAVADAQAESRKTRAAAEAAPAVDREALRAAVARKAPSPEPTESARRAEAVVARGRLDAASALANEAAHDLRTAIVEHRDELDAVQRPRVEKAADAVVDALDTLGEALGTLAAEAGVRRAIYSATRERAATPAQDRSRLLGRTPAPNVPGFDPVPSVGVDQLAALRASVTELTAQPTPAHDHSVERRRRRQDREAKAEGAAA